MGNLVLVSHGALIEKWCLVEGSMDWGKEQVLTKMESKRLSISLIAMANAAWEQDQPG